MGVSERQGLSGQILAAAAEGIIAIDRDGRVTYSNPAADELLGWEPGAMAGADLHDVVHGARSGSPSHERDHCPLVLALERGSLRHMDDDVFWRRDGSTVPVSYSCSPIRDSDPPGGAVLTFSDSTERKRFEAQLQYLADRDPLTGLYNRRRFEQELTRHLAYDARYQRGGAVLALDLDNFKYVNDTLGHKVGDEVIGRVARNIREELRESDTLARLGGDEFAILIPDADMEQARVAARVVLEAVRRQAVAVGDQQMRLSASVGVTCFGRRGQLQGDEILVEADLAMYDAKAAGRDCFALYTPTAVRQAQIESRLAWAERVRAALEDDRFVLYSQPVVAVEDGGVRRHELLLRMRSEEGREAVVPGTFLPSAVRFGLMPEIDQWVIHHAVELLHQADDELRLEVNVSAESVADHRLPRVIAGAVARLGVDPARLIVEVPEAVAVANVDETRRFAEELKALGCGFGLDDFGAGFGSFHYLKHLPFDYLKIDGDFIHSLPASRTDQLVVKAVVDIARGLGKRTSAEYVGDDDTMVLLRDLGVDFAQGYHLGRPRPAAELLGSGA